MKKLLKINPFNINLDLISKAAKIIKKGGLVAFPTETVYGLGANGLNPCAVSKIFAVKKRPLNDPLILHLSQKEDLFKYTQNPPKIALKLIDKFWPGPLTLVLKKTKIIPDIVTAGFDTVALRMPANEIALRLIKESSIPIAAPSANLFSRPSSVTAQHIIDDLGNKVDLIIDGGKTLVGIESTILDLTYDPPFILRPGGISKEELEKVIKKVKVFCYKNKVLASGMFPKHYSPKAKVILIKNNNKNYIKKIMNLALSFKGQKVGILTTDENINKYPGFIVKSLGPKNNTIICASNLFSILREFDQEKIDIIIAETIKKKGLGLAIMDRLKKASQV